MIKILLTKFKSSINNLISFRKTLLIIALMLSQSIWSNFEIPVLTPDQLLQLTLDEDIRSENLIIQELSLIHI